MLKILVSPQDLAPELGPLKYCTSTTERPRSSLSYSADLVEVHSRIFRRVARTCIHVTLSSSVFLIETQGRIQDFAKERGRSLRRRSIYHFGGGP